MKLPKTIGFEINMLANLIMRNLNSEGDEGDGGLTGMQGWIIGYVIAKADQAVFQRDIEKYFNIRRASVTGVLKLMERNGLIIREPVEYDARLKKISLTQKAHLLHELNVQRFMDFETRLRSGLSDEEITSFYAITEKLMKNI
jgi:MarR family transcriptional repressor of mepA